MKPRTFIGLVFIVASLTKLATIWGFIKWEWFSRVSEEPWVTYFTICLLIYVGVSLIIDSYRRDPDQWLQLRNAAITEDEEIEIHTFFGGIELFVPQTVNVLVKSRSFIGGVGNHASRTAEKDAHCLHIIADNFIGGVDIKN